MPLSQQLQDFIAQHETASTDKLLLHARSYPDIDIVFAVDQIIARKHIKEKLPLWYQNRGIVFPSRLAAEQCSSETTATYKQNLLKGNTLCDLTGGLGVDSWFFAQKAQNVTYIERMPEYCRAATHNFHLLGTNNITVLHADCRDIAHTLQTDTFYIDPARRTDSNKRLFALADCEPNIIPLKQTLLTNTQRLIIKISPMADISETLRLLPETTEIHILAIKNECKEILFVLDPSPRTIQIHTVSFQTNEHQYFSFNPEEEKKTPLQLAEALDSYLYEPNAAILKSGAFKSIATRFRLLKLHQHSHLYTSDTPCPEFPGRKFKITAVLPFTGKLLKKLKHDIPQANITVRNFPMTVEQIRKTSGIGDGGHLYLFATTIANSRRVLLVCEKL
nr:class I SAM-dependent methyltransferase [Odoribacter lunatus]